MTPSDVNSVLRGLIAFLQGMVDSGTLSKDLLGRTATHFCALLAQIAWLQSFAGLAFQVCCSVMTLSIKI